MEKRTMTVAIDETLSAEKKIVAEFATKTTSGRIDSEDYVPRVYDAGHYSIHGVTPRMATALRRRLVAAMPIQVAALGREASDHGDTKLALACARCARCARSGVTTKDADMIIAALKAAKGAAQ